MWLKKIWNYLFKRNPFSLKGGTVVMDTESGITITLPKAHKGMSFTFTNNSEHPLIIKASKNDTIIIKE